jgi:hypothetical protein
MITLFGDFRQLSAEKIGVFLRCQCFDHSILANYIYECLHQIHYGGGQFKIQSLGKSSPLGATVFPWIKVEVDL